MGLPLCDSTAKGKPDIELVDMTTRFRTIEDITEVTTKPIIFDGDTGGLTEHFVYTVRSLERLGVSMVIIEDKTGLKKNSLFGTEVVQTQDSIENFCAKIAAGKKAQKTKDFMICARIESLILERGMEDALTRAFAFTEAGADAIMIHSRKKDPPRFRNSSRSSGRRTRDADRAGSHLLQFRQGGGVEGSGRQYHHLRQPADAGGGSRHAEGRADDLQNHRAKECDDKCMSIKDIITLIPEE